MFALRYAYVLALVVWLGSIVALGAIVAPTTFGVLQSLRPDVGRELAGAVFGTILDRFQYVQYGTGGVMLVSLALMRLLGPRPRHTGIRAAIVAVMLGLALYSGFVVLRQVAAVQAEVGGLPSKLPAGDARRVRFDDLHTLSTRLMELTMGGALILLYWEARE